MSRVIPLFVVLLLVSACSDVVVAQFWRPVGEPNITLGLDNAQTKLEYDLSQCNCGIFPRNVPRSLQGKIDQDQQRLNETSATGEEVKGQCLRSPSRVVGECMRSRGWELTNCSGRMPTAGGASVCAGYTP
ncbi:MAG: hypothetical protein WBK91_06725 [Alphaproteobacteria bacterium]